MTLEVTVASTRQLTPDVREFVLEADDHVFEYELGHHVRIHYEEDAAGKGMARPYTATTLPGTTQLTVAIKHYEDGAASTYMHEREAGDTLLIEEPTGGFSLRDLDTDVVFVASGTGIPPMVAMLRQYLAEGTGEVQLLFGERDRAHLIYRELLDQFAAENDRLSVCYSLSDPAEDWEGPTGKVQDHLADMLTTFDTTHFYVCGVPSMVVDTSELLLTQGVSNERIFTEGWEAGVVQATADPLAIYEDLGGMDAIRSVVERMYEYILADERLAPYFDESNVESLINHQSRFIAMVAGGPEYHEHIAETHAHMNLRDEHFDAVLAYFHTALADHGVPDEYSHQLKSQLQQFRASTVTASSAGG
jgi:ferredoxin-NADP reductase